MRHAQLTSLDLPDFGSPMTEPELHRDIYAARLKQLFARMAASSLDALVIYGDREHAANISWATGYDPRFEEAICIIVPGRAPTLLAGNEGFPYAEMAIGSFDRVLWQPLSLMGQPRGKYRDLASVLRESGMKKDMRIGLAGWKGFETDDGVFDPHWFETPHYLVEALNGFGTVTNAALLFMHPTDGLRVINEVEQLARFEYAATLASNAVRRLILGAKPGMSEYAACRNMAFDGFPQSVHVNMSSGPRAKYGPPSPSMRVIEKGDPIVIGVGLMGALNCRAGFMVAEASELPANIRDYVDKLVAPYFAAAAAWYETIGIGVEGGVLYEAVMSRLADPFFGIGLNPGHLIHLDEWVHSPIKQNSRMRLASGMALQCDIIPATGTPYFMSNIEDGVALADAPTRAAFQAKFPEAWKRIESRRAFMTEKLGITLKPEVLPFSNIPAWLPPFWLSPGKVMAMR
ncbi:MAG TPA: aminopeptidase P family N-terminal domain-containing protein [Aestuariivirga sp.]|nr:aminopeptidase P family N-terminal domain-containing protein [Aestuariivirga sp.]